MNVTPIEIAALVLTVILLFTSLAIYNGWFSIFIDLVQKTILGI